MSDFLFAEDSFLAGFGRALDIGATFDQYNDSATAHEADRRSIAADWKAVGQDIQFAIDAFGKSA